VINIMTAVSQWEREAIGERTRDAMSHKRANGERVGNLAYGYRLSADSAASGHLRHSWFICLREDTNALDETRQR
jgi:DNA invertase Pin-like site-specific DNA recombinase